MWRAILFMFDLIFSIIRWFLPLIVLAAGYVFAPVMLAPIGWPASGLQWGWIMGQLLVTVAWLFMEVVLVTGRYTKTSQLQFDAFLSSAVALSLMFVIGYMAGNRNWAVPWYMVLPVIGATLDAFFSAFLAINNAAQKPFGLEQNKEGRSS